MNDKKKTVKVEFSFVAGNNYNCTDLSQNNAT